ncbi:TPA: hypothetical protein N0F65_010513 [Lagenidium giganteum]|uniref:Uncharacterized protein n=1 Tax=Lagenidium giganteum TaxID=4803 RepID=A0AAV2ZBW1_9STRA|nr:TPA: hypothetical protein N0F65_010513 [Lagenidium giganteum]
MEIEAYHVSLINGLTTIDVSECDDPDYDGDLLGARVACFTTTRYKGRLPDFSVYPRDPTAPATNPRYVMTFNADDYRKFQMAVTQTRRANGESTKQVHFLLLHKEEEHEIAERISHRLPGKEIEWEKYFPGGRANDYDKCHPDYVGRTFVNVMFWRSMPVKYKDHVKKHAGNLQYPTRHVRGTTHWWNTFRAGKPQFAVTKGEADASNVGEQPSEDWTRDSTCELTAVGEATSSQAFDVSQLPMTMSRMTLQDSKEHNIAS